MSVNKAKRMIRLAVGLAVVLGAAGLSDGQMLVDDFDDGNDYGWTHLDYTEGEPFGPATFDAGSGAYHVASQGDHDAPGNISLVSLWNESAAEPSFSNGYLQARLRADNADSVAGITLRAGADGGGRPVGYGFVASANYGVIVVVRNDGATAGFISSLPNVRFGSGRDWIFKAGAFDDQLEFKAWPAGEDEPLLPQLTVSDSTYPSGQLGVQVAQSGGSPFQPFGATFDNIQFFLEPGADFDEDGDVDGDDFLIWQMNFGLAFCPTGGCEGDADGDGDTDGDDFLIWQSEFGSGSGSASAAVPEPASIVLLIAALLGAIVFRQWQ